MRLDGGMATTLQVRHGLRTHVSPLPWVVGRPDAILDVHRAFVAAGADAVLAATFLGTADRLGDAMERVNRGAVELARQSGARLVLGSVGPVETGDAALYGDQVRAMGAVDGVVLETFVDAQALARAVRAVRRVWSGLLVASVCPVPEQTVDARALVAAGADVVGANCGAGPYSVRAAVARMADEVAVPLWCKPNTGVPDALDARGFARAMAGCTATWIGGCCGASPEHVAALHGVALAEAASAEL